MFCYGIYLCSVKYGLKEMYESCSKYREMILSDSDHDLKEYYLSVITIVY